MATGYHGLPSGDTSGGDTEWRAWFFSGLLTEGADRARRDALDALETEAPAEEDAAR